MAKSKHYYIRRTHRFMGVFLGIQFLLWTVGGLYFSWTNIDEIHGDLQRKVVPLINGNAALVAPDLILKRAPQKVDYIKSLQIVNILQKPFYSIQYTSNGKLHTLLADAATGVIRSPVRQNEAVQIAKASFNGSPQPVKIEYLVSTGSHHEYREKPLPAWAVTFDSPIETTVYVSANFARVKSFRNNKWRIFDFLWMLHTMDYNGRDNLNNWLLRVFSIIGLLTILSGFVLFYDSSKWKKSARRKAMLDR